MNQSSRRDFLKTAVWGGSCVWLGTRPGWSAANDGTPASPSATRALPSQMRWLQSARVFLIDGYAPPFTPDLEFDACALTDAMLDVHANVVRMTTMGKYATIQGVRFSRHPAQGQRDLLAEMIAACKPRGIRVVPYISTGHKLAWSMVTRDYPRYAHVARPGGGPAQSHFGTGEKLGTVCWSTPYRQAWLDLVEHVVRDYDVDGIYFDSWMSCYFWPRPGTCYCEGCRSGFNRSTGLTIPYHEKPDDYRPAEREAVRRYHAWYQDQLMNVLATARRIIKHHKDIPLIYNINNPERLAGEDPRVLSHMDAFLYERGQSMLHRAEGVSLARASGLAVWPYVSPGASSRVVSGARNTEQDILVTAMFGGGPIIYNAYQFVRNPNDREFLRRPFGIIARNEACFQGVENFPYVAVVWDTGGPATPKRGKEYEGADARSSTLGAFAACLRRHVQVSSVLLDLLDDPARLNRYKVLYLANVPHLSSQRIRNLRDFVAAGGGLVVSYGTSLCALEGPPPDRPMHLFRIGFAPPGPKLVPQDRFGLEELIRVRPETPSGAQAALIERHTSDVSRLHDLGLRPRPGRGPADALWKDKLVPALDYMTVRPLDNAVVAADIVASEDRVVAPGVVLSHFGKGRVAYLAVALESLYLQTNLRAAADIINSLVLWAAPEPAPYVIEAPDCLMANLTTNSDQRVLHLANWTGNKLEQPDLSEYYLAPVENVRVRLRVPRGQRIRDMALLLDAPFRRKDSRGCVEVTLPKVEAYQAIRFHYA